MRKLSDTMVQALTDTASGRGFYRTRGRTIRALEDRGLLGWDRSTCDIVLTVAAWDFLKETQGIERPADAGRLTLEEALADAEADADCDEWIAAIDRSLAAALEAEAHAMNADFDAEHARVLAEANRITASKDADRRRLSVSAALEEAYTPGGQVICKHGSGVNDTCDDCTAGSFRARHAGQAYENEVLMPTQTFGTYHGVPVPLEIMRGWRDPEAFAWRQGVLCAQKAARKSVMLALPPIGERRFECAVCKWKFTNRQVRDNHQAGHRK
jgi:hypothetical protein